MKLFTTTVSLTEYFIFLPQCSLLYNWHKLGYYAPYDCIFFISLIKLLFSCEGPVFDPLEINSDKYLGLNATWESVLRLLSQTFESTSGTKKDKSASGRGVAGLFLGFVIW